MLEAKRRGDYVDDDNEKRKARLDQKKKPSSVLKPIAEDEDCLEWEYDLDPELRKINEEGKRVGWAYRYRIRRKLDELKQKRKGKLNIFKFIFYKTLFFQINRNRNSIRFGNIGW
jgi:hypothetical protein